MEFKPNKELINNFVRIKYKPQTISWDGDYHLDLVFDNNKQANIRFDEYDFTASIYCPLFSSVSYEHTEAIIHELNQFKEKSGLKYIELDPFFNTEQDLKQTYEYFKSVIENETYSKIDRFLDKYGKDIQKILPDFSINRDTWKYESDGDYYYLFDLYKLEFRTNKVRVIDNENDLLVNLDWSENDE
ncbi:hypothetical protein PUW59_05300 [Lactobacillus mulieris]|nr:hypothetical protein PUW59_05300 [Lactobacillus mulieris]